MCMFVCVYCDVMGSRACFRTHHLTFLLCLYLLLTVCAPDGQLVWSEAQQVLAWQLTDQSLLDRKEH